jgi:hypothetical protein
MYADRKAYTDVAQIGVYDPAAVIELINTRPFRQHFEMQERMIDEGKIISYEPGGDTEAKVRLYIDEEPSSELISREDTSGKGFLEVPSGKLFVSGLEDLQNPSSSDIAAERFALSDRSEPVFVEPGCYAVRAFEVDSEKLAHERCTPAQRELIEASDKITEQSFGVGCLTVFLVLIMAAIGYVFGARVFFAGAGPAVAIGAVVIWILLMRRNADMDAAVQAFKRFAEDEPDVIVVLRRLSVDQPSAVRIGCRFGIAAARSEKTFQQGVA